MRKEIEKLLKSDLTSNCIATETGVEQSTIH
ncbi:DNA-binding protein, partial [Ralstonia insidiosa]|nr:DNA-binding protein [Ralstonia insidiosa]